MRNSSQHFKLEKSPKRIWNLHLKSNLKGLDLQVWGYGLMSSSCHEVQQSARRTLRHMLALLHIVAHAFPNLFTWIIQAVSSYWLCSASDTKTKLAQRETTVKSLQKAHERFVSWATKQEGSESCARYREVILKVQLMSRKNGLSWLSRCAWDKRLSTTEAFDEWKKFDKKKSKTKFLRNNVKINKRFEKVFWVCD